MASHDELLSRIRRLDSELIGKEERINDLRRTVTQLEQQVKHEQEAAGHARREVDRVTEQYNETFERAETLAKQLQELKDAMARTILKLPGGNEVSMSEAVGMVKTNDVIQEG